MQDTTQAASAVQNKRQQGKEIQVNEGNPKGPNHELRCRCSAQSPVRTVRSIPRKHRCLHRQLKQAIPYVIHALFGVAGASLSRALVPASLGSSRSSCRALSSSSSCAAKLRNDELCKCCKISSQTSLSSTPYGVITIDVSHYMKSPNIPWKYFDRSLKAFEVLV